MAFFIPFTVECDNCKVSETLKASSKRDMNRRLINPQDVEKSKWFAKDNVHFCGSCRDHFPFTQDENGNNIFDVS
jgi:hypothetical protein